MIILLGVNGFPTQIEEALMADNPDSPCISKIELSQTGPMDQMRVLCRMCRRHRWRTRREGCSANKRLAPQIKRPWVRWQIDVADVTASPAPKQSRAHASTPPKG